MLGPDDFGLMMVFREAARPNKIEKGGRMRK
jgi:hypothetical protein